MPRAPRILAISSSGGHWVQLSRLAPAWDGMELVYITTTHGIAAEVAEAARSRGQATPRVHIVPDANRWQKLRLIRLVLQLAVLLLRIRPTLLVTTGAAPGYIALRMARMIGARTIWIDSIANAEELSLSGRMARKHASVCLSQWEDVAAREGVRFEGATL